MSTRLPPASPVSSSRFRARRPVALGLALCIALLVLRESRAAQPASEFRVIVNTQNPTSAVKRELLAGLFLKKATRWPTGEPVAPVDLRPAAKAREAFSTAILKRPVAAVRQYWTQRTFSGRDLPPAELESDEAVVRYVTTHPGAVGYVSASANTSGTKPLEVH